MINMNQQEWGAFTTRAATWAHGDVVADLIRAAAVEDTGVAATDCEETLSTQTVED
jgi:hypothetical protein